MTQVQFSADIQHLVTAFGKQQLSVEHVGRHLYLSALEPDVSGECFVAETARATMTKLVPRSTTA